MNLINKYRKWRDASDRAKITLKNIWRVIVAYYRKWFPLIPHHITEQASWRLTKVRKECKDNEACTICGCDIAGLVYADSSCEGNCYPVMMDADTWRRYKKKFKISYTKLLQDND